MLELAARDLGDLAAGPGRAGEVDHRDVRVGDERLADVDAAGHDLQQAGGQAGRGEHLGEQQAAADRRLRRRLEHDGVAERERRGDTRMPRISGKFHGVMQPTTPRGMRSATLTRVGLCEGMIGAVARDVSAGGLEQLVRGAADLVVGLAADAAGLAHDQRGDLVGAALELGGRGAQDAGAHVVGLGGPARLRGLRGARRRRRGRRAEATPARADRLPARPCRARSASRRRRGCGTRRRRRSCRPTRRAAPAPAWVLPLLDPQRSRRMDNVCHTVATRVLPPWQTLAPRWRRSRTSAGAPAPRWPRRRAS